MSNDRDTGGYHVLVQIQLMRGAIIRIVRQAALCLGAVVLALSIGGCSSPQVQSSDGSAWCETLGVGTIRAIDVSASGRYVVATLADPDQQTGIHLLDRETGKTERLARSYEASDFILAVDDQGRVLSGWLDEDAELRWLEAGRDPVPITVGGRWVSDLDIEADGSITAMTFVGDQDSSVGELEITDGVGRVAENVSIPAGTALATAADGAVIVVAQPEIGPLVQVSVIDDDGASDAWTVAAHPDQIAMVERDGRSVAVLISSDDPGTVAVDVATGEPVAVPAPLSDPLTVASGGGMLAFGSHNAVLEGSSLCVQS